MTLWGEAGDAKTPQQLSTLGSSKMEIFKTDFFDVPTIHNDQTSCAKHV